MLGEGGFIVVAVFNNVPSVVLAIIPLNEFSEINTQGLNWG